LAASGTDLQWMGLLWAIPLLVSLGLLAAGLALICSALQVFIRDIAQILPPLMTFWFFTTPILYSASMLPESLGVIFQWNPVSWYVMRLREALLTGFSNPSMADFVVPLFSILVFAGGLWLFRRLRGHFEDFL
jgi:lipopolysaccharide transport system permease protein